MTSAVPKTVPLRELGPAFERMARVALAEGVAIVSVPDAEDLVIVPRRQYERRSASLRRFVMQNGVSSDAAALMDEVMEQAKAGSPAPFGM